MELPLLAIRFGTVFVGKHSMQVLNISFKAKRIL
jgi:hypothetical protein